MSDDKKVEAADNRPENTPGDERTRREMVALWGGILAGPTLWFSHQQISFVLVPWICAHGGVIWLHAATGVSWAGAAAAGLVSWRCRRRSRREGPVENDPGAQRVRFMAALGVLSAIFFSLVILAQGIPNFFLDPCQR